MNKPKKKVLQKHRRKISKAKAKVKILKANKKSE